MLSVHINTAFGYIRRSPFQAAAAIFVLSLTFFVTTFLLVLVYSSNQVLSYFESRPQVIAFLDSEVDSEAIATLQNKISSDTRVKDVKYVSKDEALKIYKEATSDNPLLAELVSPTIFPASIEFSLKNLNEAQDIIDSIKSEEIVDQVGFTAALKGGEEVTGVVARLKTITNYIRYGGGVLVGALMLTSFMILLVIIGMRLSVRKNEIEILDLIGATPGFIRSPIIFEALIYAVVGVIIGWLTAFIVVIYLTPGVLDYFVNIPVLPRSIADLAGFFGIIFAGEILAAIFIALIGSMIAVARGHK